MVYAYSAVLKGRMRPTQEVNARDRVRAAIRKRLEDLPMTQRAFGRAFSANDGNGHVDTWVSALLGGQFALSLDELDEAARILKTTAAELVRSQFDHTEYLSPTEHRIVQAIRALPASIRDHFLTLAEYLIGVAPEELDHLMEYRRLKPEEKTRIDHWMHVTRIARVREPELAILPAPDETDGPPAAAAGRIRKPKKKDE